MLASLLLLVTQFKYFELAKSFAPQDEQRRRRRVQARNGLARLELPGIGETVRVGTDQQRVAAKVCRLDVQSAEADRRMATWNSLTNEYLYHQISL